MEESERSDATCIQVLIYKKLCSDHTKEERCSNRMFKKRSWKTTIFLSSLHEELFSRYRCG